MDAPSQAQYADLLSKLSGTEFQEAVAALHVKNGVAFQSVPTKPSGDGGLDGTSHGQTVAYCCYGLELAAMPGNSAAKLATAVVEKFKDDLRKLVELTLVKQKLVHCPNEALASIMTPRGSVEEDRARLQLVREPRDSRPIEQGVSRAQESKRVPFRRPRL